MEEVAFLGDSKQIHLWNVDGHSFKQVTYPLAEGEKTPCLWPTWSKRWSVVSLFSTLCNQLTGSALHCAGRRR